ncbi:MAG: c-type cytochrome domain-containing protein [Lacipirellulaceae bacterium]
MRLICFAAVVAFAWPKYSYAAKNITYQDHVRPIFAEHCFACHSRDEKSSDLALDQLSDALAGGVGGEVLVAGDSGSSRLWRLINHEESPAMPPGGDKLPAKQLKLVKQWIDGGLLDNKNSKVRKKASLVQQTATTSDNRPIGEPAMPEGLLLQPLVTPQKPAAVDTLAASPWAPLVAIGGPRQVSLYHTDTHQLLGILPLPEGTPRVVQFSRDGSLLVVGGGRAAASGKVAVFEVKTGKRLATLGDEIDEVLAADISPDHQLLALGGPKRVVRVYRLADSQLAYEIRKHTDWITALRFSPSGKFLATGDRNGGLVVWQAKHGNEIAALNGHKEDITAIAWRGDSQLVASASEDDSLRLWQPGGKQVKSWNPHGSGPQNGVTSVDFARDGRLVTTGRDTRVKVWQVDGKLIKELPKLTEMGLTARFGHEGRRILTGDFAGKVRLVEIESAKLITELAPNPQPLESRILLAKKQQSELKSRIDKLEQAHERQKLLLAEARKQHTSHASRIAEVSKQASMLTKQRVQQAQQVAQVTQRWQAATETLAKNTTLRLDFEKQLTAANQAEGISEEEVGEQQKAVEAKLATTAEAEREAQAALQALAVEKDEIVKQERATAQQSEALLAELDQLNEQTKTLPQLDPLESSAAQSAAALKGSQEELDSSDQELKRLISAQQQFQQASQRLAKAQEQATNEATELTQRTAAAKQAREKTQAELTQLEAEITKLAKQIEEIQAAQKQLTTRQALTKKTLQKHSDQAAKVVEDLQAAQRRAELAESQQALLKAAEEVRKKYAEKPAG